MTALDPVASRSPGRTGVRCPCQGAPSAPGLVSGLGFRSPNRPDKGRNPPYRAGSRREVWCERPSRSHRRQLGGAIWGISAKLGAGISGVAPNGHKRRHKEAKIPTESGLMGFQSQWLDLGGINELREYENGLLYRNADRAAGNDRADCLAGGDGDRRYVAGLGLNVLPISANWRCYSRKFG